MLQPLYTLDGSGSTIPTKHADLVATGAVGFAATHMAGYTINQVNAGGTGTPENWENWGQKRINYFRAELKRPGRRNGVRTLPFQGVFLASKRPLLQGDSLKAAGFWDLLPDENRC